MPYKRVTQVISPKSQVSEKSSQRKSFLNSKIRSPHGTRGNKVRVLKAKRLMRSKHSDISPEIQERSYDYSRKSTKNRRHHSSCTTDPRGTPRVAGWPTAFF